MGGGISPIITKTFYGVNVKLLLCQKQHLQLLKLPFITDNGYTENVGYIFWYNTDYQYYLIRHFLPQYNVYWNIQYDCYYNGDNYADFIKLHENINDDLIISYFRKIDKNTTWHWVKNRNINYLWDENVQLYASFFPASRMSGKLIDELLQSRLNHEKLFLANKDKDKHWPLCELFVPTECIKLGFNKASALLNDKTGLDRIDLNSQRLFENKDGCLYHPVKSFDVKEYEIFKKVLKKYPFYQGWYIKILKYLQLHKNK